jgi:hypothetical protein
MTFCSLLTASSFFQPAAALSHSALAAHPRVGKQEIVVRSDRRDDYFRDMDYTALADGSPPAPLTVEGIAGRNV